MRDKYRASEVFRQLYETMRPTGDTQIDMPSSVAYELDKSRQTIRQYACDPDTKSFRVPPIAVLDKMRQRIMHQHVHRPSLLRNLGADSGFQVAQVTFDDYELARDLADSLRIRVIPKGSAVVPKLSDDARRRHQWRTVYFGGEVNREDLATIADVDYHDVAWVGREHPRHGIQPTSDMVARAIALEALSGIGRSAA